MMMTPGSMMSPPPFNPNPYAPPSSSQQFPPTCPPPGNLGMFGPQGPQPQPNMGMPMFPPQPGMFPQGMQFGNKGNHRLNVIA